MSEPIPGPAVEVRQGTVLNCDLVDFTAMTLRLGAQDGRDVVRMVLETIAAVVLQFKSSIHDNVERIEGDSVMYVFGYPQANDDDAERATLAALKAAAAVSALRPVPGVEPKIRVGVATGVVVIGPAMGATSRATPAALGPAPNLAARLRELAPPGGVVISDPTRRLVADYFVCEVLGFKSLKGIGDERAWLVSGSRRVGNRFEALRRQEGLSPLVGREQEIGLLLDRWQLAREGQGQAVFLSGEPGVGKSRLLSEVMQRSRKDNVAILFYQCTPYHRNTAFHPIVETMLDNLGLAEDAPVSEKRVRVDAYVRQTMGLTAHEAAAIARVLSLDLVPDALRAGGVEPACHQGGLAGARRADDADGGPLLLRCVEGLEQPSARDRAVQSRPCQLGEQSLGAHAMHN